MPSYPALPWPKLLHEGHPQHTRSLIFRTGLARVMENLLDHIHVPFVHGYEPESYVFSEDEVTTEEAEIKMKTTVTRPDGTHPVIYDTICIFPALAFTETRICTYVYTAVPIHAGATLVLSTYLSGTANPLFGKLWAWIEGYWEEKEIWPDDVKLLSYLPDAERSRLTKQDSAIAAWYVQARRVRSLVLDWNEVRDLNSASLGLLTRGKPEFRDHVLRPLFRTLAIMIRGLRTVRNRIRPNND